MMRRRLALLSGLVISLWAGMLLCLLVYETPARLPLELRTVSEAEASRKGARRHVTSARLEPALHNAHLLDKRKLQQKANSADDFDVYHRGELKERPSKAPTIRGQRMIHLTPVMKSAIKEMILGVPGLTVPRNDRGERLLQVADEYKDTNISELSVWEQFHLTIRRHSLYGSDDTQLVDEVLKTLAQAPIIDAAEKSGGTQLKVLFTLESDLQALFKPLRFPRADADTKPDHFYFSDFERHFSEIACFHLDRALGFHRAPPVIGRLVNVTYDIKRFADSDFASTFFISPAKNWCFHGDCSYYCDTGFAVCGNPYMLEGSMQLMIPRDIANLYSHRHPWRRSYSKRKKAAWETNSTYCAGVKQKYKSGRRLLDIMDLAVYDFLSGNLDRHHFSYYKDFGQNTSLIHLDQGRGFGKPFNDDLSILAPITQCCLLRHSTLLRLIDFYRGPVSLSSAMRKSMEGDPASPVLLDKHYRALDRRLAVILYEVSKCVQTHGSHVTIVDDGF